MSILTGAFLDRFPDRVVNLHPSLLPAFPGHARDRAGAGLGRALTGVTVHFAEELVDARSAHPAGGRFPCCTVTTAESLTERIREVEHRLVPEAVRLFAAGRVRRDPVERRRVEVVPVEVE